MFEKEKEKKKKKEKKDWKKGNVMKNISVVLQTSFSNNDWKKTNQEKREKRNWLIKVIESHWCKSNFSEHVKEMKFGLHNQHQGRITKLTKMTRLIECLN